MATWREWLRKIGELDRKEPLTPARQQKLSAWIAENLTALKADLERAVGDQEQKDRKAAVQQLISAQQFYELLVKAGVRVPKPMTYASQLIILWHMDLEETALDLQKKREITGQAGASYIWYVARDEYKPAGAPPALTSESRVYVLAHGAQDSLEIFRDGNVAMTPEFVAAELKKRFELSRVTGVERVNLVVCWSAGNPEGRLNDGVRVGRTESFAHKLFEALRDQVKEVVGYSEEVTTRRLAATPPGEQSQAYGIFKVTGKDKDLHKHPDRKVTFYKDDAGVTQNHSEYLPRRRPAAAAATAAAKP
jgi:hypothetical protein